MRILVKKNLITLIRILIILNIGTKGFLNNDMVIFLILLFLIQFRLLKYSMEIIVPLINKLLGAKILKILYVKKNNK